MSKPRSDIGPYCIAPLWLAESVSANALKAFVIIAAAHADRNTGEGFPSRKRWAAECSFSVDTLDRAIKELESAGALSKEPRQTAFGDQDSNVYTVQFLRPGSRTDAATPSRTGAATGGGTGAAPSLESFEPDSKLTKEQELTLSLPDPWLALKPEVEKLLGLLPGHVIQQAREYARLVPELWFRQALELTQANANRPSWAYCKAILDRAVADQKPPKFERKGKPIDESTARGQMLARYQQQKGGMN